ncbi:MAG: hypothetical protein LC104_18845 [Bacteroidales bacterium]|nr:hypothetical protein [Bacteroidales bacterium]
MMRWARTGTIVASMVWSGFVSAQAPNPMASAEGQAAHSTPATKDGLRDGEVLVLNSAGQPTRRLQVLKISSIPNGPTLVDVKDLESGGIYTLPAQALAAARRVAAHSHEVASKPADASADVPPQPASHPATPVSQTPVAQTPNSYPVNTPVTSITGSASVPPRPATYPATDMAAVPLAAPHTPMASPSAAVASPAPRASLPAAFMRNPVSVQTMGGWPRMERAAAQSQPQHQLGVAQPQTVASTPVHSTARALPRFNTNSMMNRNPTPLMPPQMASPEQVTRNVTPAVTYHPMPIWQQQRFHRTAMHTAAASPASPPAETASEPMTTTASVPAMRIPSERIAPSTIAVASAPAPVREPTAMTQATIQQASLSVPTRVERTIVANVDSRMVVELQPWVNDLAQAIRPSVRETAASALAGGRYGSRREVKATLAQAAMTDPADSVQAHCIRLLSGLGYHETQYLNFLRATAYSGKPEARTAATIALARLAPR